MIAPMSSAEAIELAKSAYKLNVQRGGHRKPVRNPHLVDDGGMLETIQCRRRDGNPTHFISCTRCRKEHAVFSNNDPDLRRSASEFRQKHMKCGSFVREQRWVKEPGKSAFLKEEIVWKTAIRISVLPIRGRNIQGNI